MATPMTIATSNNKPATLDDMRATGRWVGWWEGWNMRILDV
ncbi:MAG: hypothetical protein R3B96_16995 [Pirellulaceae bacterium]